MKTQPDLDDLISAWLDGRIDETDLQVLECKLSESNVARARFIQLSQQDSALREIAESFETLQLTNEAESEAKEPVQQYNQVTLFWKLGWIGFATVVLILLFTQAIDPIDTPRIRLKHVEGPTQFQASDSTTQNALKVGDTFSGGTFHLDSQDSKVEIEFSDTTSCYVWGNARYHIENNIQKRIVADYGQYVLDVQPQPDNLPFLFKTQNAELTVIGTSFIVTSSPELTALIVFDGEVAVKRLLDGKEQMVPTGNRIIIHTGETGPLDILSLSETTYTWKADFNKSLKWGRIPNEEESGIIANEGNNIVLAIPTLSDTDAGRTPSSLSDRIELFVMNRYPERVLLGLNSVFQISGSVAPGTRIEIQFLVYDPSQGQIRSFHSSRRHDQNNPKFHFELPILEFIDFRNGSQPFKANLVGRELIQINVFTAGTDSQLRLSNLQLDLE